MKLCSKECEPLCDFCIYFREDESGDNLKEEWSDGICVKNSMEVHRLEECENFVCFRTIK